MVGRGGGATGQTADISESEPLRPLPPSEIQRRLKMARRKMTPARAKAKAQARRQKVKEAGEALVHDVLGPLMDEGRAPNWAKPWGGILGPTSMATGNAYAGRNRLVLMLRGSGYTAPIWMTFNRAKTLSQLLAKERGETHAERSCAVDAGELPRL